MKGKSKKMKRGIVLVLCVMLGTVMIGCGEVEPTSDDSPDTSAVESEVSSTSEVSEIISEESSSEEITSEEVSEPTSEESTNEVEFVNFSDTNELLEYINGLNKTTIVEYNFGEEGSSQAIIPNEAEYTMQMGNMLRIVPNKEVIDIKASVEHIDIMEPANVNAWAIFINATGRDLEVSFTVNYVDGTSEDFTIYVTVE